jgi:hypothetical protein
LECSTQPPVEGYSFSWRFFRMIAQPPTANRQPPTANRQPPTANRQPPTATMSIRKRLIVLIHLIFINQSIFNNLTVKSHLFCSK